VEGGVSLVVWEGLELTLACCSSRWYTELGEVDRLCRIGFSTSSSSFSMSMSTSSLSEPASACTLSKERKSEGDVLLLSVVEMERVSEATRVTAL
jgi:hypothetical protein